jgi:hypothetical protein
LRLNPAFAIVRGAVSVPAGGLVVTPAARIKYQRHQADSDDQRSNDADRHGGIAVAGHLDVGFKVPSGNAGPDGDPSKGQKDGYEDLADVQILGSDRS